MTFQVMLKSLVEELISDLKGDFEDLVKVAEDFVDAKVQIDHLKNGGKGELPHTKELAVITRTEGVVWIKHCLYGN